MRFPSGQPSWQNGMPQSMQRDACSRSSASGDWELELAPVAEAAPRPAACACSVRSIFEKPADFTHGRPTSLWRCCGT